MALPLCRTCYLVWTFTVGVQHSSKPVKFWLVENFLSPQFKDLVPKLADKSVVPRTRTSTLSHLPVLFWLAAACPAKHTLVACLP